MELKPTNVTGASPVPDTPASDPVICTERPLVTKAAYEPSAAIAWMPDTPGIFAGVERLTSDASSNPPMFRPHPHTSPALSSARETPRPPLVTALSVAGIDTRLGVELAATLPSPLWPTESWPQNQTLPSLLSARTDKVWGP